MGSVGSVGQPGKVQPCYEEEYAYQPSGTPMYPPRTEEIFLFQKSPTTKGVLRTKAGG